MVRLIMWSDEPNHVIRPFENRTEVSEKLNVQISDGYCTLIMCY